MTRLKDMKHPRQPIGLDDAGVIRFKQNSVVLWTLKQVNLNDVPDGLPEEDYVQFWQLLGYSVSGFGDLPFIPDEEIDACDAIAEALVAESKGNPK